MDLISAMRGQYCRSERLLWASISVRSIIYLTTLATALWSNATAAAILLVLACVGQGLLFVLRFSTQRHLALAEQLRRLAMLKDGLGRDPAPLETAVVAERIWTTTEHEVPSPYYSSRLPKGPKRLVDLIAECAFFSGSIGDARRKDFSSCECRGNLHSTGKPNTSY